MIAADVEFVPGAGCMREVVAEHAGLQAVIGRVGGRESCMEVIELRERGDRTEGFLSADLRNFRDAFQHAGFEHLSFASAAAMWQGRIENAPCGRSGSGEDFADDQSADRSRFGRLQHERQPAAIAGATFCATRFN
ncbi:MAG: hypothetical protein ABI082_01330 [Dokdonella sp.]